MKRICKALAMLAAISLTSCTPFKIAVSDGLTGARELPVKGRNGIMINQKLNFGEYKTAKIDRSWTQGSALNAGMMEVLWTTYSQSKQRIHFTLQDTTGNVADVYCLARTRAEDWTLGKNPNSLINIMTDIAGIGIKSDNTFAVNIYHAKDERPWEMMLDLQEANGNSKRYNGYLAHDKHDYYTIHPITTVDRNGKKGSLPIGLIGYEFKNKAGVALAGDSLMDNGKVYLSASEPKERFLLANACSALLLYQTID